MNRMKAVEFIYESSNTLIIETPKPFIEQLADNEVLIKVKYSAMDTAFDDVIQKTAVGGYVHKRTTPLLLGWHFSGVVVEAASTRSKVNNDTPIQVGTAVFGHLPHTPDTVQGAIAEYIVIPLSSIAIKPDNVPFEVAAAATVEALTALQAVRDVGGLDKGHSILINGAGGQVGGMAVQIAKHHIGAKHVTAICSTKDVDRVRQLGADIVIDRHVTSDVYSLLQSNQFHVIFDTPNALASVKCLSYLQPSGRIVTTLPIFPADDSKEKVRMVEVRSKTKDLALVGKWLAEGTLKVDIDSIFAAKDASKALERNRDRNKQGRVVIQVENGW